ncbi:hypothetical protein SAMN05421734_102252 [Pelagirhabdus alkalitolerans]|uniref:Uncharacterized protein n=1 Tax=Pelagirhabdus alkalitolerans TaxID=1612202 RepID=A0A1G6H5M6_9BACI|nr:hypothetical protein [Pelagirhabdus alkalitolerans]SDB89428.1 hypothetical protein SAMN05421734_102252 [Pelagirhabdus alkalitolerans]
MKDIEWNNKSETRDNIIVLKHLNFDSYNEEQTVEENEARGLNLTNVVGYIDDSTAIKINDDSVEQLKKDMRLTTATPSSIPNGMLSGDDKMNEDQFKYMELKEDLRESERRISNSLNEREERFEKDSVKREERFEKSLEKFAIDSKEREERFMKDVAEIKNIVYEGEKNRTSIAIAIWTLAISTILGIAAMVITVLVSL